MIFSTHFAAGHYCDNAPDGRFAVGYPTHLETHLGAIPLFGEDTPNTDLLFVVVTKSGPFKIAGQGHDDGRAWLYADGVWSDEGPTHGTSPCVFDRNGQLHVMRPAPDQTSQGYRYCDETNRLVTGDETYRYPGRPLWEYSTLGGVTVAQGEGGAHVVIEGQLRLLEPGDTRFIRLGHEAGRFSVAIVKPDEALLCWASHADLVGLPLVTAPPPLPPLPTPPPPPVPDPDPDEEYDVDANELTRLLRNQSGTIQDVKRDYPDLKGADIVDQAIHRLNRANGTTRYGRKARQKGGVNPNSDVITIRLMDFDYSKKKLIDVLVNAHPGDRNKPEDVPTWDVRPDEEEDGNGYWMPAVHPDRDMEPPPPVDPPPVEPPPIVVPPLPQPDLLARIEALEVQIVRHALVLESHQVAVGRCVQRGTSVTLRGTTGRTYSHAHPVTLIGTLGDEGA